LCPNWGIRYSSDALAAARAHVDYDTGHCDDILANLVVAVERRSAGIGMCPIALYMRSSALSATGISGNASGMTNRFRSRAECAVWLEHNVPRSPSARPGSAKASRGGTDSLPAPRAIDPPNPMMIPSPWDFDGSAERMAEACAAGDSCCNRFQHRAAGGVTVRIEFPAAATPGWVFYNPSIVVVGPLIGERWLLVVLRKSQYTPGGKRNKPLWNSSLVYSK